MDQYIGKMLDSRYEILERIGTGGMAVVYKAKCHRLNRLVALKILKDDLAQDEDFRRRFNAESQAVAQLSHPNIVSVYDVSRGGDTEYIVMELIDGITLKQYMEKRGRLNWRESLHFITQIMRGLSHAHSRGIVHRDIKPQNIMVLRDGSVKVADFGIACLENAAQTLTQEALGSVHYISPEQARGDRTDARSDIYSAGVVLYEMLTGRLPFEGDSAVSVAIQHLSSIPLAPREIDRELPAQLELICMKAMAPDLSRRYAAAENMICDLEAFRKNPGVSLDFDLEDLRPEEIDEPTMPLRKTAASSPPHRAVPARERRHQTFEEEEPPERRGKMLQIALATIAIILATVLAVTLFRSVLNSVGSTSVPQQYVVPEVVGLTVEEARRHQDVVDVFTITEVGSEFSDEYEAGVILRQDPEDGDFRKGDSLDIQVWISAGEDVGQMIDVTNRTVAEASILLKALREQYDLVIEAPEEAMQFSEEVTQGHIISTIPEKEAPLKKGDTITLIVSKGPELKPVTVPDFVGKPLQDVQKQLVDIWHLTCTDADVTLEPSSEVPSGEIIWQSLSEGTVVTEWDSIQFRVSSGPPPASIDVSIELPQDGRNHVLVEIFVGSEGLPQFSQTIRCADIYAYPTLSGNGTQEVRVYFDGKLDHTQLLQFE